RGSRPASSSASWLRTRSDNDDVEQMGKRPGAAKQVAGGKSVGCQTRVRMWIAGPGAFGGRGSFPDRDLGAAIQAIGCTLRELAGSRKRHRNACPEGVRALTVDPGGR